MRFSAQSSVGVPEDEPLQIHVDASAREASSDGKTRMSLPPLEIELPKVVVDLGRIRINLPKARFHVMIYVVPVVETPAGGQRRSPVSQQGAGGGYAAGERLNRASRPPIFVETDVDWGKTEVQIIEESKTTRGVTRVHATPVNDKDQAFWVEMDAKKTIMTGRTAALDVSVEGSVVLDG